MKTNEIKKGQQVKYRGSFSIYTVKEVRKATKDHFGDVLTPATVVYETQDGTCWDTIENFEVVQSN